jgi:hypothetical protein
LESLDIGDRRFDVIFAVRVRDFHRDPTHLDNYPKPGGRANSVMDAPAASVPPG